jgi:hypothetical protein
MEKHALLLTSYRREQKSCLPQVTLPTALIPQGKLKKKCQIIVPSEGQKKTVKRKEGRSGGRNEETGLFGIPDEVFSDVTIILPCKDLNRLKNTSIYFLGIWETDYPCWSPQAP